jgi:hypothetical protein
MVQSLFDGDNSSQKQTVSLMDQLEEKGWDVHNRLYLGYSSHRIKTIPSSTTRASTSHSKED